VVGHPCSRSKSVRLGVIRVYSRLGRFGLPARAGGVGVSAWALRDNIFILLYLIFNTALSGLSSRVNLFNMLPTKRKTTSEPDYNEFESQGDNAMPINLAVNEQALVGNQFGPITPVTSDDGGEGGRRVVTYHFDESRGTAVEETKVEAEKESDSASVDLFDSLLDDMEAATNILGSSFRYQPLSMVCSSCQRIIDALSQAYIDMSPEKDWKDLEMGNVEDSSVLQERASKGCALCRERLRERSMFTELQVDPEDEDEDDDPSNQVRITAQLQDRHDPQIKKYWHWLEDGYNHIHLIRTRGISMFIFQVTTEYILQTLMKTCAVTIPSGDRKNPNSVGDINTMNCMPLLKEWLHRCYSSHEKCQRKKATKAPSRLIFIGNEQVCLKVDTDRVECLRYATLSHCVSASF
jgi:hypothetical protein